ncbi:MAG: hypothetical protein R3F13_13180 [Prosthecobacter sp.]
MPYKDPKKRAEANKKACAKWREKNLEYDKVRQHQIFQRDREAVLARMRERNRSAGHKERPKGPKAKPEIVVPVTRRWRLHRPPDSETLIYFTTRKGFTFAEVRAILKEAKSLDVV